MMEKVSAMGVVMGQTLIAGDLAALMAHKRLQSTRNSASVGQKLNDMGSQAQHLRSHR